MHCSAGTPQVSDVAGGKRAPEMLRISKDEHRDHRSATHSGGIYLKMLGRPSKGATSRSKSSPAALNGLENANVSE